MDAKKPSSATSLKKWTVLSEANEETLEEVKYFHEFQTYIGDDVRNSCALFLTVDDEMFAVGYNNEDNLLALSGKDFAKYVIVEKPTKIPELSGKLIKKFEVSERFGAALTTDGKLLYWGTEMKVLQHQTRGIKYVKQPYEPKPKLRIVDMACGAHSITLITDKNEVILWGCINLYYSEFYDFEKLEVRKNLEIKAVSCGWYHVALLDQNGQVWTFGYGSVGQRGYSWDGSDGYTKIKKVDLPQSCVKVECGTFSTLFLLKNGEVYACGSNSQSDVLCVSSLGYVLKPEKVLMNDTIDDIAATYAWSLGRWQSLFAAYSKRSEKYFKWGNDLKLERPAEAPDAHSLLEVFANFKTPLSLGELIQLEVIALEFQGGQGHNVKNDSTPGKSILQRWSIFDDLDESFRKKLKSFMVYGDTDSSVGDVVNYGAFVVTEDDDVYSWGFNGPNKLLALTGHASENNKLTKPHKVSNLSQQQILKIGINYNGGIALSERGFVYTWSSESPPTIHQELQGHTVVDISCGIRFYAYIAENNDLYINGQMSVDFPEEFHEKVTIPDRESLVSLATGHCHCAVLMENATVYTFGDGTYGQLGYKSKKAIFPHTPKKVVLPGPCMKIECGVSSTFFLLKSGELYACGVNSFGDSLGVGHGKQVYVPEKVKINEPVENILVVRRHSVVGTFVTSPALKTTSGKIYTWGHGVMNPAVKEGAKSLLEAFDNYDTPQSLALIALDSDVKIDSPNEELDRKEPQNNNGSSKTLEANLFGDPLFSDVTITLADGVLPAHRVILHSNSALFRKKLSKTDVTNREQLDLTTYNPRAVRAFVMYLYGLPVGRRGLLSDLLDLRDLVLEDGNKDILQDVDDVILVNMVYDIYLTTASKENVSEEMERLKKYINSSPFP